jgi:hypothetical protein
MQKYKQLDLQDRHTIHALLEAGHSQTKIAEIIGVHKSTISRELTRNVPTRGRYAKEYRPQAAQRKTNQRHRDDGQTCYRGVCYKAIDENGKPVECAAGDTTELYTPPTCGEGNICSAGRCIKSRTSGSQFTGVYNADILACGSGMIRLSGTCVSLVERECRNCKTGEVCLGGACYGLTEKMGEPCKNNRCSSGSRCLSGICIKQ